MQTYTWTGNKEIAESLTALFSKDGGKNKKGTAAWNRYRRMPNQKPWAESADHGVHFMESTAPWALGYLWTGNRELLDAPLAWYDLIQRDAMQPTGVPVADEHLGPTGAFRGTETCDVAGYMWSQIVLLTVSGQGRLADRMERAFFDAGAATVARDFKTHVYFQTPNRVADKAPPCPNGPGANGTSYRPTHYPLCCTAALNRIVPNYVMHMWMATYDNGLAAAHYGPCKVVGPGRRRRAGGDRLPDRLPVQRGRRHYGQPGPPAAFPLSFRIPGWCKTAELSMNGSASRPLPTPTGSSASTAWKPDDNPPAVPHVGERDDGPRRTTPSMRPTPRSPTARFVRPADSGHEGPQHARPGRQVGLCVGCARREAGRRHDGRTWPMPGPWDWPLESPLKLRASAVVCDSPVSPKESCLPPKPIAKRDRPRANHADSFAVRSSGFRCSRSPNGRSIWRRLANRFHQATGVTWRDRKERLAASQIFNGGGSHRSGMSLVFAAG